MLAWRLRRLWWGVWCRIISSKPHVAVVFVRDHSCRAPWDVPMIPVVSCGGKRPSGWVVKPGPDWLVFIWVWHGQTRLWQRGDRGSRQWLSGNLNRGISNRLRRSAWQSNSYLHRGHRTASDAYRKIGPMYFGKHGLLDLSVHRATLARRRIDSDPQSRHRIRDEDFIFSKNQTLRVSMVNQAWENDNVLKAIPCHRCQIITLKSVRQTWAPDKESNRSRSAWSLLPQRFISLSKHQILRLQTINLLDRSFICRQTSQLFKQINIPSWLKLHPPGLTSHFSYFNNVIVRLTTLLTSSDRRWSIAALHQRNRRISFNDGVQRSNGTLRQ